MIDRLVRALVSGSDLDAEEISAQEILDVLWLASAHPATGEAGPALPPAPPEEQPDIPNGSSRLPPDPPSPPEAPDETPVPLRLEGRGRSGAGERVPAREVAFAAPGPIRDVLAMPRALRRFRQVRAPGRELSVDIEATVAATAEAGRLMAVFSRREERGLDLVLVTDGSSAMRIWDDTFDQFEALAAQSGAFRSVSRWRLVARGGGARIEDPVTGVLQPPRRLIDPSGRRVVLLATDASHEWWYTGAPWEAIATWCAAMPTALVQVLPPHYWAATAVGTPYVTARARRPAEPNGQYARRLAWWAADPGGAALPVMTLTSESIEAWARAAVAGTAWAAGITATPPDPEHAPSASGDGDPDALVNGFLSRASPGAERLARVLATAGRLSLPLIAVLQEELAPGTGVPELAEIMAGGLLEEAGDSAFRFRAGAREILRRGATAFDEWDAYGAVSRYLTERQRAGGRLRALIPDPGGSATMDAEEAPFADLRQALAVRLGLRPVAAVPTPVPAVAETEPEDPGERSAETVTETELASVVAAEVEAIGDFGALIIAEYAASGLITWTISRDPAGTPHVAQGTGTFAGDQLGLPAGTEYLALLVCTAPAVASAERSWRLDRARYPGTTAIKCETGRIVGIIDAAIMGSPLTRQYELAVLSRGRTGRLDFGSFLLFGLGARSGERVSLIVECLPGGDRGTVFAVVAGRGPDDPLDAFVPVQTESAVLDPGTYEVTVELLRPGSVRITGLPVGLHEDSRAWDEIVAAIPARVGDPGRVHLIVAIETSSISYLAGQRFESARKLIKVASRGEGTRFSVVRYGAHRLSRSSETLDERAMALVWAADSVVVAESRLRLIQSATVLDRNPAAQLECALALIASLLTDADGRPVLVTIGSRPAYPVRADPLEGTLPCPNQNDWRAALGRLERIAGMSFGAIQNDGSSGEIWNRLSRDARAEMYTVDIERFAAELGLVARERQAVPIPVLVPSPAPESPAAEPAAAVAPEPSREREPATVYVASENSVMLLGASGVGKTTFLAAVNLVLVRRPGPWRLHGRDDSSTDALIQLTEALVSRRAFPDATEAFRSYHWVLEGSVTETTGRFLRRQRTRPVSMELDLVDGLGSPEPGGSAFDELIERLARCRGILYMFDPTREAATPGGSRGDAFYQVIRLAQIIDDAERGSRLPHYLAVCVTKLDEPSVYETARESGLLTTDPDDPYQFPRVADYDAEELFERLCQEADATLPLLFRGYFMPERIRYFVTSSTGFNIDQRTGTFDPDDFQNVVRPPASPARIRGPIHPVNVIEPVLWLAQRVTGRGAPSG